MTTPRILAIALLATGAAAAPALSSTVPVDGVWVGHGDAVLCDAGGQCTPNSPEDAMFRLRGKVVSGLKYSVPVACVDGATGYDRYFTGGSGLPAGRRLNARDALSVTFTDTDRLALDVTGTVRMTINYRGATPTVRLTITTTSGTTPCSTDIRLPLKRSIIR